MIVGAGLIYFIINLKLKKRLWMSSSSYSILFIKKNTKQVYGKGQYLKMQHTNTKDFAF